MKKLGLDETLENMRKMGEVLTPYNFPHNDPKIEDDLNAIKIMEGVVDGYRVQMHYNRADYGDHILETFQIFGHSAAFLPFAVVVKLAKKMLGGYNLSLVEIFKDNRKIYCWTVCVDKTGKPLPAPHEADSEHCVYEGFQYIYMHPSQINFY